ncbi:DUF883 family protein [Methylophaga thiooxydans]|uniref:DUF883 family protein n=1 Tax=Methylophaga thiooxydans TaxID=392484 RepID=UPI002353C3D6|nr:hypothetical protein [Methylophaga thiooxydans]
MATQANNQELQEQVSALRKDFGDITETLKSLTSDYAKQGQARVKQSAEQAQKHAQQTITHAQQEVEARPYTSMAVAFGVGVVIGKLLDR